jgi:arsenate reductase
MPPTRPSPLSRAVERLARSAELGEVSPARRASLSLIARRIARQMEDHGRGAIVFGCTHNSRRSILSEVWATVAAQSAGVEGVTVGSAGSEPRGVAEPVAAALRRFGFGAPGRDGRLEVGTLDGALTLRSKGLDDPSLPASFGLIVNCGSLDESCPHVPRAEFRLSLLYADPRHADGTPGEDEAYDATCVAVGRDQLLLFQEVKALRESAIRG